MVALARSSRPGPGGADSIAAAVGAAGTAGPGGALEHATSVATAAATSLPRIGAASRLAPPEARVMWIILLEPFGAGALLVLIVWWTMFSGRRRGAHHDDEPR